MGIFMTGHRGSGKFWTTKEDADLDRLGPEAASRSLGRTIRACYARRDFLRNAAKRRKVTPNNIVEGHIFVPRDAIAERDQRRELEHQTTTAALMGDPLPGYSALEKYHRDLKSA